MSVQFSPVFGSHPRRRRGNHWESFCPFRRRVETSSSDLEDQIDVLLSIDPTIEVFCEQPLKVQAVIDGEPHSSILDYWMRRYNGRELFREAKYESDLARRDRNPQLDLQLRVQEQWASDSGSDYGILTDALTRRYSCRVRNGKLILGFLRARYPTGRRDVLSGEIGAKVAKRPHTYGELLSRFRHAPLPLVAQSILSLLVVGNLAADLDTDPLNEDTLFREHAGPLDEHPFALQY